MRRRALLAAALPLLFAAGTPRPVLDDFRDVSGWKAFPADGVRLELSADAGSGGARGGLRLDFDFAGHAGWAAVRKAFPMRLPENWAFRLRLRGETAPQTLEFKLLDARGENVWWSVRRAYEFPRNEATLTFRRRQVSFAWGPAGGGDLRELGFVEIAITAEAGGRGTVWLEELDFEELPAEPTGPFAPRASASSESPGFPAAAAVDGDPKTFWRSGPAEDQQITLDLGTRREFGGLVLDWDERDHPRRYEILLSDDGARWEKARQARPARGGRAWLDLRDADARFVRVRLLESARGHGYALAEAALRPPDFSETRTKFLENVARESPAGTWPRSFVGQQLYWTIVGVDGGRDQGLLSEDGALEAGRGGFSVEPFLWSAGRLLGWSNGSIAHSLERGDLPIPTVVRRYESGISLEVTAFADGPAGSSTLVARYRVRNDSGAAAGVRLLLALRPLQVNPPEQFLNLPGGFSPIHRLAADPGGVSADGRRIDAPAGFVFGGAAFDAGEIGEWLSRGQLPPDTVAEDADGLASGALAWEWSVPAGGFRDVAIAVSLAPPGRASGTPDGGGPAFEERLARVRRDWQEKLDRFSLRLPPGAVRLGEALRSSLAWILVERDGPAIRPGVRSYARSWIRDGAMMAAALLRLGHAAEVRDYLRWYAPNVFASGRVPCCVDRRGADPVPENDSGGELLHMAAEYLRFTGDRETVGELWPTLARSASFIDELRRERRTATYLAPDRRIFFGLLPESISHEGYSARPVHSYWDDFWAVLGLSDAASLASALGRPEEARRLSASRDELRHDLHASIRRVIAERKIDYIPGSAELADWDATSTTIALDPGQERPRLPQRELDRTFERYWREFQQRRFAPAPGAAYTPYEWRLVGTLVRLGWRERAGELFDALLSDRRPPEWNGWAEVVGRDARAPRFIGDMPHGWVASDFIRSALDLFAYERPQDAALVLGAGVFPAWLADGGLELRGLHTRWGTLDLAMRREGATVVLTFAGTGQVPPGGYVLRPPLPAATGTATVDGHAATFRGGELVVKRQRAEVAFGP